MATSSILLSTLGRRLAVKVTEPLPAPTPPPASAASPTFEPTSESLFQPPALKRYGAWTEEDSSPCGVRYFATRIPSHLHPPLAHSPLSHSPLVGSSLLDSPYSLSSTSASSASSSASSSSSKSFRLASALAVGVIGASSYSLGDDDDDFESDFLLPAPVPLGTGYQCLASSTSAKAVPVPSTSPPPPMPSRSPSPSALLPPSPLLPSSVLLPYQLGPLKSIPSTATVPTKPTPTPTQTTPPVSRKRGVSNLTAQLEEGLRLSSKFPRSRLTADSEAKNWNAEYQRILTQPLMQRGPLLQQLSQAFAEQARRTGKIIIRERPFPLSRKTVKPVPALGQCGGVKYRAHGIFFKFATDQHDLVGGDMNAMKVAGHELKGLTAFSACGIVMGVAFPMLTLIDYRGHRLIAMSELPISGETIAYGSNDGGYTVHSSNAEISELMQRIAGILNLKGHMAGLVEGQRGFVYGPCDLEGHIGKDGRFYVLDLARVFPPQTPERSLRGSFLYRLLRPEFVARFPVPLSSDAFSAFADCDADSADHNRDVERATARLLAEVVPEFARSLAKLPTPDPTLAALAALCQASHRAGVNLRYLSRVRDCLLTLQRPEYARLILTELVSRGLKHILRQHMRQAPFGDKEAVVAFYNAVAPLLLGRGLTDDDDDEDDVDINGNGTALVASQVLPLLETLYGIDLTEPSVDLPLLLDGKLALLRVQELTGAIVQRDFVIEDLPLDVASTPVKFKVLERRMYAIPRIEADSLVECGRRISSPAERRTRTEYLELAREKYSQVLQLKPDDSIVLTNMAAVLVELARHAEMGQSIAYFARAFESYKAAASLHLDAQTLSMWGNGLFAQATRLALDSCPDPHLLSKVQHLLQESRQKYRHAISLCGSDQGGIYFNFGSLLLRQAQLHSAFALGPTDETRQLLCDALTQFSACPFDAETLQHQRDALHMLESLND